MEGITLMKWLIFIEKMNVFSFKFSSFCLVFRRSDSCFLHPSPIYEGEGNEKEKVENAFQKIYKNVNGGFPIFIF